MLLTLDLVEDFFQADTDALYSDCALPLTYPRANDSACNRFRWRGNFTESHALHDKFILFFVVSHDTCKPSRKKIQVGSLAPSQRTQLCFVLVLQGIKARDVVVGIKPPGRDDYIQVGRDTEGGELERRGEGKVKECE